MESVNNRSDVEAVRAYRTGRTAGSGQSLGRSVFGGRVGTKLGTISNRWKRESP